MMDDNTIARRSEAYLKIGHLLWCPTDIHEKNPDTIFACGDWTKTGAPFKWSVTKPPCTFGNPSYDWRNPTLACYLAVWQRIDEDKGWNWSEANSDGERGGPVVWGCICFICVAGLIIWALLTMVVPRAH